jgi:hypothetical protein
METKFYSSREVQLGPLACYPLQGGATHVLADY